jgi:heme exporter protein A
LKLLVEHLTVERGGRLVIGNLDLTVDSGEALILTGPNGAGKTTLLRTLAGLLRPAAGRIDLDGGDADATVGEQCHLIGHSNAVKASLTVRENVVFWSGYMSSGGNSGDAPGSTHHALEHFGLASLSDIPARYLSAGQTRRLGLCRLLLAHRPVWLLDEPTVSLDTASAAVLATAIDQHVAIGGMVIAATHLPLGLKASREFRLETTQRVEAA